MKKLYILLSLVLLASCGPKAKKSNEETNKKIKVVVTTTMLTDLVKNIGGDKIVLEGLMNAGVDPHLYKATEGDATKLFDADVIVYSGLHLEGKFEDIFNNMRKQNKNIIVAGEALEKTDLVQSSDFEGNYDPHMWFDTNNWIKITKHITNKLVAFDKKNTTFYRANEQKYLAKLTQLTIELTAKANELPIEKRILVTAHDAFNYFGRQFNFKVEGLQGLSTTAEAGVQDVQELSKYIIDNKIKAIFVESSVAPRTIQAVQSAVKAKSHKVEIGGTLYSDTLGTKGSNQDTYIGMYKTNMNTIVNALK